MVVPIDDAIALLTMTTLPSTKPRIMGDLLNVRVKTKTDRQWILLMNSFVLDIAFVQCLSLSIQLILPVAARSIYACC
jgi:hypothetical protein